MDGGEDKGLQSQPASTELVDEGHSPTPDSTEAAALPDKAGSKSAVEGTDETSRLRELQAHVRDQDDLERDIGRQVRTTWIAVSMRQWLTPILGRQAAHGAGRRSR